MYDISVEDLYALLWRASGCAFCSPLIFRHSSAHGILRTMSNFSAYTNAIHHPFKASFHFIPTPLTVHDRPQKSTYKYPSPLPLIPSTASLDTVHAAVMRPPSAFRLPTYHPSPCQPDPPPLSPPPSASTPVSLTAAFLLAISSPAAAAL